MANLFLDTFTGADGSIANHVSDSGDTHAANSDLNIYSNSLTGRQNTFQYNLVTGVVISGEDLDITWDALWGGGNSGLQFMLSTSSSLNDGIFISTGYSGTHTDLRLATIWQGTTNISNVEIISGGFPTDHTVVAMRVTIIGTAMVIYANGSQIASATLAGFDSNGMDLYFRGNGSVQATNIRWDNFSIDTFAANQIPVITLLGSTPINHEAGTVYTDAGATASDTEDGDITGDIVVTGSVDHTTLGQYILSYDVQDSQSASAVTVQRTVNVVDTTPPVITLTGSTVVNLQVGDSYTEQGATWTDYVDGSGAATVGGDTVNTGVAGTYIVTYNHTDTNSNVATQVERTVNVAAQVSDVPITVSDIPDGLHKTYIFSSGDVVLYADVATYASGNATITNVPVAAGEKVTGFVIDGLDPHVNGAVITSTTV